jgi:hypothetical protein
LDRPDECRDLRQKRKEARCKRQKELFKKELTKNEWLQKKLRIICRV